VIKVLLVGDVLDGEITEIEDGPDHRLIGITVLNSGTHEKREVKYHVAPIVLEEETFHIGRAEGVGFAKAIGHVLDCYHLTSNTREFHGKFADHDDERPEYDGTGI
jgi:hypothetical protein